MQKLFRQFDAYLWGKYVIAAIILVVSLYQKFPLFPVEGTFVSVRVEDFLLAFASILVFILFLKNPKEFLDNKVYRVYALFLLIGLVSSLNAIFLIKTVEPKIAILHFLRRIEYFVPFILGFEILKSRKEYLGYFFNALLIVVFCAFIYGAGQKYFSWPIIVTQNQEYSQGVALKYVAGTHINSTFAGHYDLASFLTVVIPIIIAAFFVLKDKLTKLQLLLFYLFGMWLLVNSASRISFVSLLVSQSIALFLIKKYKEIPIVFIVSLVFILFSSNLVSRYQRFIDVYFSGSFGLNNIVYAAGSETEESFKRVVATPTPTPKPVFEDRSRSIRLNVEWPRAIRAFYKNPLLGTGYSSIDLATDNDFLRMLGEVGMLGLYTFFIFWARILWNFYKVHPLQKYLTGIDLAFVAGVIGSIPGIFLNAVFIDVFEASKFATIFWLLLSMALSMVIKHKNEHT